MSISPEKLDANRANAAHSTGPNTDDGKAKSSQNATKHGLTGKTVVLPHEDKNAFQRFSVEVIACLAPEGVIECEFAQIVANAQWRLRRIKSIEDGMLAYGRFGPTDPYAEPECFDDSQVLAQSFMDHTRSFSNLSHYEHRLYRNMTNALKQIKDLQAARDHTEKEITREANSLFNMWQFSSPTFGRLEAPPGPAPGPAPPPGHGRDTGQACAVPAALSPDIAGQRRESLVSGFVFPTDQIPNEKPSELDPEDEEKEAA